MASGVFKEINDPDIIFDGTGILVQSGRRLLLEPDMASISAITVRDATDTEDRLDYDESGTMTLAGNAAIESAAGLDLVLRSPTGQNIEAYQNTTLALTINPVMLTIEGDVVIKSGLASGITIERSGTNPSTPYTITLPPADTVMAGLSVNQTFLGTNAFAPSSGVAVTITGDGANASLIIDSTSLVLNAQNLGVGTGSEFGSGTRVLGLQNAIVEPSAAPSGGGVFYASSGNAYWMDSTGTKSQLNVSTFQASCTASESIGDLVYLSGSGAVTKADATTVATAPAIGIIVNKPSATVCDVRVGTAIISGFSGLVAGQKQFLSTTAGGMTSTAPSTLGNVVQEIGRAITATQILMQIDADFVVI